ncbi:SET domain-containing protein [Westerdykella ornata]|uniref:SET domain-containing protein n=1 Tax=Westerdykella ornata TaxID=318751 RepID=A0A6A6JMH3_WESOR|nr:SET domain-containing protein [Westerdykella ornata]KAF2277323.1 SET domain-containing protein [Westerdykella ornata]
MPRTKKRASRSSTSTSASSKTHRHAPLKRPTSNTQKRLWQLTQRYRHVGRPLSQRSWVGCDCAGACEPATCSCLRDQAPCRQSCVCGPTCAHQFPVCECTDGCAVGGERKKCPCYQMHYQYREGCGCFSTEGRICDDENELPKTEVKESEIPSAGLGLFAKEDIEKGRLIGVMAGEIEPNPEDPDFDCFEIADGISLRCSKEGVYYAHERHHKDANAEYRYMEGKRKREMVLRAMRYIGENDEITAQYRENGKDPCFDIYPVKGAYAMILGDTDGAKEPWVGKILSVDEKQGLTVQWLLRKEGLHWIPSPIREKIELKPGELIMTKGWVDTVDWESFIRVVWVNEEEPDGVLNKNTWWWTRRYDAVKQKMLD